MGVGRPIKAVGISSIMDVRQVEGIAALEQLFPLAPRAAAAAFRRPHWEVFLMIGMKNRELHCTDGLRHGSLRLYRTRFSPGWVLMGYSPHLEVTPRRSSPKMMGMPQDAGFQDGSMPLKWFAQRHGRSQTDGPASRIKRR